MEWIEHQGKKILNNDLADLSVEDFIDRMRGFERMVLEKKAGDLLVLSDIRGAKFDARNVDELKRISQATTKYIRKYAVVGVTGVKKILFAAVQMVSPRRNSLEAFDTIEAAKDWLVK